MYFLINEGEGMTMETSNINIEKNEKMPKSFVLIFIITGVILVSLAGGIFFALAQDKDVIVSGVRINDMDASGLSCSAVKTKLEDRFQGQYQASKLNLSYQGNTWEIPFEAINGEPDYDAAIEQAYAIGHEGNMIEQLSQRYRKGEKIINIDIPIRYSEEKVSENLNSIKEKIESSSQNAAVLFQEGDIVLREEIIGRTLNEKRTLEIIRESMYQYPIEPVILCVDEDKPTITDDLLKNVEDVLGKFTTKFNAANIPRSHNVAVAAQAINNTMVKSGEIFSFNKVVGLRSKANGYVDAPVIVNNELVPGIGGGVCQVSSTLYNAVLYGNLGVKQRSNHSLAVGYVPLGQDATVADGAIDFQFMNTTAYPVYLKTKVKGNALTVWILGKKEIAGQSVQVVSNVVEVIEPLIETQEDDSLSVGTVVKEKAAKTGYKVRTTRIVRENGKVINEEDVFKSYYRPVKGMHVIGTKKTEADNPNDLDEGIQDTNDPSDQITPEADPSNEAIEIPVEDEGVIPSNQEAEETAAPSNDSNEIPTEDEELVPNIEPEVNDESAELEI